jgi:hypothetical protein
MARVYYVRGGQPGPAAADGEDIDVDTVIERFRGHRKVALGPTPPALQPGLGGSAHAGKAYVIIEIGPEDVRPPEFLDIGFYIIS